MNEPTHNDKPRRQATSVRWPHGVLWLVLAVSLLGLLLGAFHFHAREGDRRLQEAIAAADQLDPGWRLAELEARRELVSDAEDSFRFIQSLDRLPNDWWSDAFHNLSQGLILQDQLNEEQVAALREELAKHKKVLAAARKLVDIPRGQFRHAWSPADLSENSSKPWEGLYQAERIAELLVHDAMLLVQQGKPDEALMSCQAAINAGRSVGDHPSVRGQRSRRTCVATALKGVERTLAQGEPGANLLAVLQRLLEAEEQHPGLLIALRGERAVWHARFSAIEAGRMPMQRSKSSQRPPLARIVELLGTPRSKKVHAARLHYLNESVEIAKLSLADQDQRIERGTSSQPMVVSYYDNHWTPTPEANLLWLKGAKAEVRCGIVMLVLERYRKAHGCWPDCLAELVPDLLQAVPADPFDRASLRYEKHADSVVISSEGITGFRLWDVDRRRQQVSTKPGPGPQEEK